MKNNTCIPTQIGESCFLPNATDTSKCIACMTGYQINSTFGCDVNTIANNAEIDVIWEKWQQTLEPLRETLNNVLKQKWEEWEIPREADAKSGSNSDRLRASRPARAPGRCICSSAPPGTRPAVR